MKLKVASGQDFEFTGNVKALIDGLSRVMAVTNYVSSTDVGRHHLLVAYKKKVYLCGYSTETGCLLHLEGFVAKRDGSVSLKEPEKIGKLLKGRTELNFAYEKQTLTLSEVKGRFSCTVASNFVTYDQAERIESISNSSQSKSQAMGGDLLKAIRSGVKYCRITDVHMKKTLLCAIKFDGKRVRVNSTCEFHAADYQTKAKCDSKPFMIALPADMFSTVDKFVGENDVTFIMSPAMFVSYGEGFVISFPPIDIDENRFESVTKLVDSQDDPVASFDVEAGFHTVQVNFSAYATNGERMLLKLDKKSVSFNLDTDSGSTKDKLKPKNLKTKTDFGVQVDPRTLDDIFRICPKSGGHISFFPLDPTDLTSIRSYRVEYKLDDGSELVYLASTLD